MKHSLKYHGWLNDKAYCDYAKWWDCSFWCNNNKIFGRKLAFERVCPYLCPNYKKCKLRKKKTK